MSDAKGPIKIHTRFAPQRAKTPPMHTLPPTHHTPNRSRSTIALNGPSGARTRFDLRQPTTTAAATHTHTWTHTNPLTNDYPNPCRATIRSTTRSPTCTCFDRRQTRSGSPANGPRTLLTTHHSHLPVYVHVHVCQPISRALRPSPHTPRTPTACATLPGVVHVGWRGHY